MEVDKNKRMVSMRFLGEIQEPTNEPQYKGPLPFEPIGKTLSPIFISEEQVNDQNQKILRSKIISSTMEIPFSAAYDQEEEISKEFQQKDSSWIKTATNSFKRGIGNTYVTFGRALQLAGIKEFGEDYVAYGRGLQYKYAPLVKPEEFTFEKVLDPDWWATTPMESIPFTISLIPAALIAAYAGAGTAGAIGLGAFGKLVMGSIGAGTVSRVLESAMEAGGTYDEALSKGEDENTARQRANYTFKHNLIPLTGVDITQFLVAFTPLGKMGATGPLLKRIAASALVKMPVIGAMEAGEEIWQEVIQQVARGEKPRMTPNMKEGAVISGIFGFGLGGAGSVWTTLTGRIENTMNENVGQVYKDNFDAQIVLGSTSQEAQVAALDAISDIPEGKAHIEKVVNDIKNMAEDKIEEKEIDIEKEIEKVYLKKEEEFLTDEDIKAIGEGKEAIDVISERLEEEEVEVSDRQWAEESVDRLIAEKKAMPFEKEKLINQLLEKREIPPAGEAVETPKPGGGKKMFISEETYEKAKKSLKEKLSPGTLMTGIDPTALVDMVTIGAYHIEHGVRKFVDWSEAMIMEFGEDIKPHLRKIWRQANDYLEAKVPTKAVKPLVRATTGQISLSNLIREDVALSAAMKKAEQNARIAYREGGKDAIEKAKSEFREVLLKARIKAETFAFKEGFRVGSRLTGKHLIQTFKDTQIAAKESREMVMDYISENLPADMRGKFLNAIIQNLTKKKQVSIFQRVEQLKDKLERKELVKEIAELKELKGDISVDYQKKIKDLLGDIDTKKITSTTLRKLEGLKDYIEREGVPSGISTRTLDGLRRLEMKQANEMTKDELQFLVDTANHLTELGKLKAELKYKYNERLRQLAINKLLESTYNIDPILSKEETLKDKIKKGGMFLYLDTLQNARVTDLIDGYRGYRGENTKLSKKLISQETKAILNTKTIINSAIEEMLDAGVKDLTEEQQQKIMINIRNTEGAFDQVKTLMDNYGYEEIPDLTEQESKVIEIIKKYTNQNKDRIGAIYEELENKEFVKLANYILPIKYEKEFNIIPMEAIQQTRHRITETFQGFTIERQKGVKKLPRIDLFGIFEEAINEQQWYIQMQPDLENIKYLVKTKEYTDKAGELASNWWKDHLDIVARRGNSATANYTPFTSMLKAFRLNLNKAILGYKLSSIIMQPFALIDAMAYTQSKFGVSATLEIMKEFTKAFVIPGYAKEFIDVSPALQIRTGGEVAIQETLEKIGRSENLSSRFIKGGLSLLQKADVRTAAGVESGLLNVLEKKGIENAKEEAEFLMNMVSGSSEITQRPHILGRGEASKTWFTFQTFFLNRWGLVAHDLISSGLIHGDWKAKYGATLGLGIIIAGALAEDEARKFMYETIVRRKIKDDSSMMEKILFAIPYNIPYLGALLEATVNHRSSDIPIIRTIENLFKGVNVVTGKTTESKVRGILRSLEAAATLRGITGTAQFFDLVEGLFLPEENKAKKARIIKPKLKGGTK